MYTHNQIIKEIRSTAKEAGLTFRVQKNLRINGSPAYCFTVRGGGEVVFKNCTLMNALENCLCGYISSFNKETGYFDGVNHYQ